MPVFQRSIVDEAGNVMPLASVEVRDQVTSGLVQLYSNYALSSTIGNPTTADSVGFVRFYVAAGRYRITATSGALSRIWEDEVLGFDGDLIEYSRTPAEISAGVTPVNKHYVPGHLYRFGTNTAPGTTDMTTALNNCYASCKAAVRVPMIIPAETQRFTSKLVWDGAVDVIGENAEYSKLAKDGNFDGVEVVGSLNTIGNFSLFSTNAADTAGRGLVMLVTSHMYIHNLYLDGHGGHNLAMAGVGDTGFFNKYHKILSTSSGGDGVNVGANHFHSFFDDVDSRGNTASGFRIVAGAAYHMGNVTCQQNTGGGAEIAGLQNSIAIYAEANTGGVDILLTSASNANHITILHVDTQADFDDQGTDNQGASFSASGATYFAANFGRPKRFTNAAGRGVVYGAGAAGAGASPFTGGTAFLSGGDAAGTGNADGGKAEMRGGGGVGTGREGDVILQQGNGLAVVGAASAPAASAKWAVVSTTLGAIAAPKMTTAQRDAISSPTAGLQVYNTTTNKLNFFNGATWEAVTSA